MSNREFAIHRTITERKFGKDIRRYLRKHFKTKACISNRVIYRIFCPLAAAQFVKALIPIADIEGLGNSKSHELYAHNIEAEVMRRIEKITMVWETSKPPVLHQYRDIFDRITLFLAYSRVREDLLTREIPIEKQEAIIDVIETILSDMEGTLTPILEGSYVEERYTVPEDKSKKKESESNAD